MKNIEILKAIANDRRAEIVKNLMNGNEINVSDLEKLIGISQSALSQHLAILRIAGIVKTRRVAQTIYYRLVSPVAVRIINAIDVKPQY